MMVPHPSRRAEIARIWQAAIESVRPQRLLAAAAGDLLGPLPEGRIAVVGAGKAAAGMAAGVEGFLAARGFPRDRLSGLVSVPEGCVGSSGAIEVRHTRPAGANLPTARVVAATGAMLAILARLGPDDLGVALVTGGGSELLAQPRDGIELDDKIALARFLAARGAGITEINTVRRAASAVKAGGLARACRAGRLVVLVLSDVIGDPLDLIASGPCMPSPPDPGAALDVLDRYGAVTAGIAPGLVGLLRHDLAMATIPRPFAVTGPTWETPAGCRVSHRIVGNNDTAVDAAADAARSLGYEVVRRHADPSAPALLCRAESVGRRLAAEGMDLANRSARDGRPRAIIEGGEATVEVPDDHGTGGRNQQTVIAAVEETLGSQGVMHNGSRWPERMLIASIGTDGEDGPTDAAGGVVDAAVARHLATDPAALRRALFRCDAGPLLESAGGLVRTGPTGTNVADVRIVLARE